MFVSRTIYLNITDALRIRSSNENEITWDLIILMEPHYISDMYPPCFDLKTQISIVQSNIHQSKPK